MTAPEDVGQAERRTASGGGVRWPLNLIHRNKVPNPIGMRVSSRLVPSFLRPFRKALYLPVSAIPHLPGGPVRWLWIVRLVVTLDTPLRRVSIGRPLHAKSE
jgi:hypothetical protein